MGSDALSIVLEIVRLVPQVGHIAEAVAKAIWGGDVKAVEELTKTLPTTVQMHARAAAVKADERRKAVALFGAEDPMEHGDTDDDAAEAADDAHGG